MDNTTSQPNSQVPLNSDQIASSLAFATNLHEQTIPKDMPQQGTEAPQEPQNSQGQEQTQETQNVPDDTKMNDLEGKIDKKLDLLRDEVKGHLKLEIESLKKTINDALENDTTQ